MKALAKGTNRDGGCAVGGYGEYTDVKGGLISDGAARRIFHAGMTKLRQITCGTFISDGPQYRAPVPGDYPEHFGVYPEMFGGAGPRLRSPDDGACLHFLD